MRCICWWKVPQACKSGRNLGDVARFDRLLTTGQRFSWENSPKLSRRSYCVAHTWRTLNSQRKGDVLLLEAWCSIDFSHGSRHEVFDRLNPLTICLSPIKSCSIASHVLVWNGGVIEEALFMIGSFERNIAGVQYKERETIGTMHKVTCEYSY